MNTFEIILPTGSLRLSIADGRPSHFSLLEREILLFPHETYDFEAFLGSSRILSDALAALSSFFYRHRGMPSEALVILIDGRACSVPIFDTPSGLIKIKATKCKQLYTKNLTVGGVTEAITTVRSERTARLIEAGDKYPEELLRRLRVTGGDATADYAISYAICDDVVCAATTFSAPTADDLIPLAMALSSSGRFGRYSVRCGELGLRLLIRPYLEVYLLYDPVDIAIHPIDPS